MVTWPIHLLTRWPIDLFSTPHPGQGKINLTLPYTHHGKACISTSQSKNKTRLIAVQIYTITLQRARSQQLEVFPSRKLKCTVPVNQGYIYSYTISYCLPVMLEENLLFLSWIAVKMSETLRLLIETLFNSMLKVWFGASLTGLKANC